MAVTYDSANKPAVTTLASGAAPQTYTSNSFSPQAGEIIVVVISCNNTAQGASNQSFATPTNTGTALTWHSFADSNLQTGTFGGRTSAWWAFNANTQASITVSIVDSGSNTDGPGLIAIQLWGGANTTAPIGAIVNGSSTTSPLTLSITPQAVGSGLAAVVGDWSGVSAPAGVASGTGLWRTDSQFTSTTYGSAVGIYGTSATAIVTTPSLSAVSLSWTSTGTPAFQGFAYEILAAAGGPAGGVIPSLHPPGYQSPMGLAPFNSFFGGVTTSDTSIAGVSTDITFAAPSGLVSVTDPGVTAGITFAAPTGSASVTINGPTATITFVAPAGTASVTDPGTTATITFGAPTGSTSVGISGPTATITFAAPAGVVAVTAPGTTGTITFAAPTGSASVTIPGVTAAITFAAPAGLVSVTDPGVTGTITFGAPAGTASVTLPGTTAVITFGAPAGNFTTGAGVVGQTTAITFAAPAGTVAVTLLGVTATITLAAPTGSVVTVGVSQPIEFTARPPIPYWTTGDSRTWWEAGQSEAARWETGEPLVGWSASQALIEPLTVQSQGYGTGPYGLTPYGLASAIDDAAAAEAQSPTSAWQTGEPRP